MATTRIAPPASDEFVDWLSADESHAFFDEQAQRLLGFSGREFLTRWQASEYTDQIDDPEHPELLRLLSLLPFGQ